ncbi:MAG: type II secretion system GspH family protein [Chlamydiales bacterium]|nr:type II secretion system GspH family protein [Chlamydiales bacterium]
MKKKKNTFTLIEVLIAIALATSACFFLLEFQESYIKSARLSLRKIEKERYTQEAYVRLLEQFYTNQISWKAVLEHQTYSFSLSDTKWQAQAALSYAPHGNSTELDPTVLDARITLTLLYNDEDQGEQPEICLCLKKEGEAHVQAPQT